MQGGLLRHQAWLLSVGFASGVVPPVMVERSPTGSPMAQGPVTQRLRGRVQGCITGLAWAPHAAQLGIASAEGELILVDFQAGVDWPLRDAKRCRQSGL